MRQTTKIWHIHNMNQQSTFAKEHKNLFWDIPAKALNTISGEALLERTLAYGNMREIEKLFDMVKYAQIPENISQDYIKETDKSETGHRKLSQLWRPIRLADEPGGKILLTCFS